MTRKDFELIAATLKAARFEGSGGCTPQAGKVLDYLAEHFADRLQSTNAAFNRDRFLLACGVTHA